MTRAPRPYGDPYLAGVGIGLVLLAAFAVVGRGLGASGAISALAASGVAAAAPAYAAANPALAPYTGPLWADWLVVEIVGVAIGGFLSAALAGRLSTMVERGGGVSDRSRNALAVGGGALMGVGARFAGGCTSGQGLTGGALLSVGAWLFIGTAFAAAYLVAPLTRRAWS